MILPCYVRVCARVRVHSCPEITLDKVFLYAVCAHARRMYRDTRKVHIDF